MSLVMASSSQSRLDFERIDSASMEAQREHQLLGRSRVEKMIHIEKLDIFLLILPIVHSSIYRHM